MENIFLQIESLKYYYAKFVLKIKENLVPTIYQKPQIGIYLRAAGQEF